MPSEATRRQVLAAAAAVIVGGPLTAAGVMSIRPEDAEAHHMPGHTKKPRHRPGNTNDAYNCSGSPITITTGGTYSGCYVSTDPDVPAVTIDTSAAVIIQNAGIRSQGPLISAPPGSNANLTVLDTIGVAVNPGTAGRAPGRFVEQEGGTLRVEYCSMFGTSGMYFLSGTSAIIKNNHAVNIDGRHSTGAGYSSTDRELAQFIQCNQVVGHIEIGWNRVRNVYQQSWPEDVINLYQAHGSSGDRAEVHHNLVDGAYPPTISEGFDGSGIMLDDDTQWAWVHDNTVVSTTNVGIAIAGGHDNLVEDCRIVGYGRDPSGTLFDAANVGAYVWNFFTDPAWDNNNMQDVAVSWTRNDGVSNPYWHPDVEGGTGMTEACAFPITQQHEADEVNLWEAARAAAGQWIGPR